MISGINAWAVGVIRCSAGIVDWTMEELVSMDRRLNQENLGNEWMYAHHK